MVPAEITAVAKKDKPKAGRNTRRYGLVRTWKPSPRQWAMYEAVISGRTYLSVGEEYGCSKQCVSLTVKKFRQLLEERYLGSINELRTEHSERLMYVYCEAMEAWRKSIGEHVVVTKKDVKIKESKDDPGTPAIETTVRTEMIAGNPAFLMVARAVLADIRRVWGVDYDQQPNDVEDVGDRVAGVPRPEAIKLAVQKMMTAARKPSNN